MGTHSDGNRQHDRRDHSAYPLSHVEYNATTGAPKLADISAEEQFGLAFWAVSAVELDLFNELAAARLRTQASAP
jgi:hypothetical protein